MAPILRTRRDALPREMIRHFERQGWGWASGRDGTGFVIKGGQR